MRELVLWALLACTATPAAPPPPPEPAVTSVPTVHRPPAADPAWSAALNAAKTRFIPLATAAGAASLSVAPVEDPAGATLPHLVNVKYGEQLGQVLVVGGAIAPGGGPAAATAYVRQLGGAGALPRSRELLAELAVWFRLVDRTWLPGPFYAWSDLDEPFDLRGDPAPALVVDPDGALHLELSRTVATGEGDATRTEAVRVSVAADGGVTVHGP